ncbi:hypothetical protein GCM10023185_46040 [Hymenobacter saemangeumensis]|uniref:STAS/SEC14 domain-containing protein n=1 Tax=Hymenobacter saemangeumensis TaxID=1084522 RepID=A0ABP8ISQ5_9BACT
MLATDYTHLLTLPDAHGAPLAEYLHYPADELLHVRWHGQLTSTEVIRVVQHGGQWRQQLTYTRLLNDKRDAGGDWSEALPWLQYEWLPQALAVGIKALAYVLSPRHENGLATQQFVQAVRPHLAIELFDDLDEAVAWLRRQ